jgi:hypothetical protein
VRHQRWQALCTIALAPALGRPQVWRTTQSALQTRELREVKKKQEKIYSKGAGVSGGICQKSVKSISTVVEMHLLMTVPIFRKSPWWLWGDRCHLSSRSSQLNNGYGDPVEGSDWVQPPC